jgi:predicted nucleic acid-binding protein
MTVFVDTSAFYAVFDRDDANHPAAKETWTALLREPATLLTTNYVLVETAALLQHRLGVAAVRSFHEDVVPLLQVDWITEEGHRAGAEAVLAAARKKLSLVDCVSFQTMRRLGVRTAFCFNAHFSEQGFTARP